MANTEDYLKNLAAEYFLRDLSEEELEELQTALRNDPQLGNYFIETARDEWLMSDYQAYRKAKTILFPVRKTRVQKVRRIAAAAALLLTFSGIYLAQHTRINNFVSDGSIDYQPVATVVELALPAGGGSVSAINQGEVRALGYGDPVYTGDRIVVPVGGSLMFSYIGERTFIFIAGGSLFAVSDQDGAKRIHLTSGHLHADVDKQKPGMPMKITTHDAEVVVLGTSFEVLVDQFTRLSVQEGRVRFATRSDDQSVEVGAGMVTDSRSITEKGGRVLHRVLLPVQDDNIGLDNHNILHIDPKRNHQVFLKFDVAEAPERIAQARLRLQVSSRRPDGGGGVVRLHAASPGSTPENALDRLEKQISEFRGKIDLGEFLEFEINPRDLRAGLNTWVVTLDKLWGDDIWMGSTEAGEAPELILKMKPMEHQ
ncbi:hypothetical protein EGM51_05520 [Verrucomicrobia bacterium S94]|nr:hypothetical protein EGM51_05520 [Verrucomicrobia bacterium S94]